jgi:hypothetical protein
VLTQTAQVATNFDQDLMATLPTSRDIRAVMLMAPAVHPTGPGGSFSVAGSMSFENLFMVNGVSVNENLRGQPNDLIIEDAVQETVVATAGVSAEYGRFGGGVINVITKSGGNRFSGSFRDTLSNDDWRSIVPKREGDPFANDTKADKVVPIYEYTAGGPVARDRLWLFTAGRMQTQSLNRQLVITNIPYVFEDKSQRYEFKVTYSLDANHRFQGAYTKVNRDVTNNTFNATLSMDMASLEDRSQPEDLFTVNYTGVLAPNFFVEGRYSQRNFTFVGSGSKFTDPIKGTLLVDPSGRRYNSATFCGVCTNEERDNQNLFVKGSYFLSTGGMGSHNMTFGYDLFNDVRLANNHQSGSTYRFVNAPAIVEGTNVIASFVSGTTIIQWNPIFIESQGTDFRTHSLFFNDSWRLNGRLTANLGLRLDRNDGTNGSGELVAKQTAFSPRLGLVWDPAGDQQWSVTGSVARYVAGILNSIADQSSAAGNADEYRFIYRGADINTGAARVSNEAAIQQVFDWFNANGGANLAVTGTPTVRGVSPQIGESLDSPSVWEYASGVNRTFGGRAALRADFVYRDYKGFYIQRTDLTTGRAVDTRSFAPAAVRGREYDLTLIENDDEGFFKRRYSGVTFQGQYRFGTRADFGANYTLSRAWGNLEGETVPNGPITAGSAGREAAYNYPEYRQQAWNYPEGDLSIDQRHRARLWVNFRPWVSGLTFSLLQALESGVPYSASNQNSATVNGVDPRPSVTNPGYVTPPDGAGTQYFYTARDAFRLEGQKRTDFAAMYSHDLRVGGGRSLNLFVQGQLINIFNQFQLCGCGGSAAFTLGGNVQNQTVDSAIRTNVSNPTLYQPFNPFTTTPIEGTHWAKSPTFGKALNRFAYTTPRTVRVTFGLRF